MTSTVPFPSLVVRRSSLEARGSFAEALRFYTQPDEATVASLTRHVQRGHVGIVAHFYMDPELQGVVLALRSPHVHVSDSLVMADRALDMVKSGARAIIVLGVDFMAENVRATLDAEGYRAVPVYRVVAEPIGCSLAESAESASYRQFLAQAQEVPNSLHVVYINTSLGAKAFAESCLPTITCTSSNVVSTILTAARQIPGVHIWYGPDTYMGQNLVTLLLALAERSDDELARLAVGHTKASIQSLLTRFHPYQSGHCIVHHLFGDGVARRVAQEYKDAWLSAHLEVPGAMFQLALAAQREGRGVVGSTSDILNFISARVADWAKRGTSDSKQLVLGTETGLVTSIVRGIQTVLGRHAERDLSVEIVFPVAEEAVAATAEPGLPIVPGPARGEGCSPEGGCASCPYMKQNSLSALVALCERLEREPDALQAFWPKTPGGELGGLPMMELGRRTILAMRHFSRTGSLSDELVAAVRASHSDE